MSSPADVTFYQEQGYLVVPDVLDDATLARIRTDQSDATRRYFPVTDEPTHTPRT